jgi:hypothetical protein
VHVNKEVTSVNYPSYGTVSVVYTLTVSNTGTIDANYDLSDQLQWGDGLTVSKVLVVAPGGSLAADDFNGRDHQTLATDQPIAAGASVVWQVTVTGTLGSTLTAKAADCQLDSGEHGTGLLNSATVDYNGLTENDTACAQPKREEVSGVSAVVPPTVNTPTDNTLPVNTNGGSGLALTGAAVLTWMTVAALALGLGLTLSVVGRRRRQRTDG